VVRVSDEYPPEWPEIAERIKDEAGWECERCGHPHEPELTLTGTRPNRRPYWEDGGECA
jgi:hypothetical protein